MSVACPSRTQRRTSSATRLTDRDLQILELIERAQPIATRHVEVYLGMSGDMARRRLRALRDLGLIHVHVVAMHQESRFTLSGRGRSRLAEATSRDANTLQAIKGIGKVNLAHHEGSVDVFVSLSAALRQDHALRMEQFLFEEEIRERHTSVQQMLIPDAIAVFDDNGRRFATGFEIDCETERVAWFTEYKALPYSHAFDSGRPLNGCQEWRVCCVVPTAKRRNALVAALWDAGVTESLWYFALSEDLSPHSILAGVWRTARILDDGETAGLVAENPFQSQYGRHNDPSQRK